MKKTPKALIGSLGQTILSSSMCGAFILIFYCSNDILYFPRSLTYNCNLELEDFVNASGLIVVKGLSDNILKSKSANNVRNQQIMLEAK